jgi:hypothetical protein
MLTFHLNVKKILQSHKAKMKAVLTTWWQHFLIIGRIPMKEKKADPKSQQKNVRKFLLRHTTHIPSFIRDGLPF